MHFDKYGEISIHAPRMGSDLGYNVQQSINNLDFNPRSPYGERPCKPSDCAGFVRFQSTLPVWGATVNGHSADAVDVFQSTLPVWGATRRRQTVDLGGYETFQSTLPVWGATWTRHATRHTTANFNPRSPYGERPKAWQTGSHPNKFQSTLPVWGATNSGSPATLVSNISIHAPRMGSDLLLFDSVTTQHNFNPRSPYGERHRRRKIQRLKV